MKNLAIRNLNLKMGIREAIVFSLLFHLLALLSFIDPLDSIQLSDATSESKERRVRIKVAPREKSSEKKPTQIVNTRESQNKSKKEDARFLGQHTQTVDRETTSSQTGSFKSAGKGVREGEEQAKVKKKKIAQTQKRKLEKTGKKKINFSDLSMDKPVFDHKVASANPLGLKNGVHGKIGLSQNNDFIEEIPLGDMTNLNTIETKYYGFYHRIRQRLEQYWGDSLNKKVSSLYKRGRKIASETNHVTSLKIKIDSKGEIIDILIQSTSGIQELDEAAIESFSKAGPFPNPPSGMIKDGFAELEWGFVVKG